MHLFFAGLIISTTVSLSGGATIAAKLPDPNCFGEQASNQGQNDTVGEHASIFAGKPYRVIGNVGDECSETHPVGDIPMPVGYSRIYFFLLIPLLQL